MNLIRNLVGLIITITMLPICIEAFTYTSSIEYNYNQINDEIALFQLREVLLISYDMNISTNELNFKYKNKNYKLSEVNNKLLLQPGTQIYLNDIDDLYFKTMNGCIYVEYERNNTQYKRIIGQEKGIYLDDFSCCDVFTDEPDISEE